MADFHRRDHRRIGGNTGEHRDHGCDGENFGMRQVPAGPLNADAANQQSGEERRPFNIESCAGVRCGTLNTMANPAAGMADSAIS